MVLCGSCASQAPLDDTYYWPDKNQKVQEQQTQEKEPIEYLNVQDTTVTIRINR